MNERVCWEAGAELAALLRRYYQGEGGLWGEIQTCVHAEVQAYGLPVAPRHVRFRRLDEGYQVIVELAEAFHTE